MPSRISEYAVVYDISNDRERNRVSKILIGFGFRIQKSVFECRLTRRSKEQLTAQLGKLEIKTGFIKLYRLEYHAKGSIIGEGVNENPDEGHAFIV